MALIADSEFAAIRVALEITLTHRCTLQRMTTGAEDAHGNAAPTPAGAAETSVPCRYETIQRAVRDDTGLTLVSVPSLSVSATLAPSIGDQVTAIVDQLGVVILAGPARIERVLDDTAGLGASLLPTYELRAIQVEA